jgi:hypothetical protein
LRTSATAMLSLLVGTSENSKWVLHVRCCALDGVTTSTNRAKRYNSYQLLCHKYLRSRMLLIGD